MKFYKKDIEDYWFPLDDILQWFENKRTFIRDIKIGIKNLINWFPVIWKDRYWDNYFLYEILRFKISDMEKNIRKNGMHLRAEHDANKMKLCVNLLDRLIDDDYMGNALKHHDIKWGEGEFEFTPVDGRNGLSSLDITRPNVKTPKDEKQEIKEWKECIVRSDSIQVQDLELLFKTMTKHVRSWWD
jgi:hypothetical protein